MTIEDLPVHCVNCGYATYSFQQFEHVGGNRFRMPVHECEWDRTFVVTDSQRDAILAWHQEHRPAHEHLRSLMYGVAVSEEAEFHQSATELETRINIGE